MPPSPPLPPLKIYLLGGLRLEIDDQPVTDLVSQKAELLVAYLAMERRVHSRETLATLLWDDRSQKQALSNLRTILTSLRKRLAPYLSISRKTMGLNPEAEVWLDVTAFEQELAEARQGWPSDTATAQFETALERYQGDFLAGIFARDSRDFDDWMALERERLRQLNLGARQTLISHYLNSQQYQAGLRQATALLQLDPLHEAAQRQMMLLLARSGQRAAALSQYEQFSQLLEAEMGLPPSPETEAVYHRLQASAETQFAHLPQPLTSFVGRHAEIRTLTRSLRQPDCRLVTVVGLGGAGKTRLALQVADKLKPQFLNGVCFISLAEVTEPDFVASTIAEGLGLSPKKQAPLKLLLDFLKDKELLLVLDNFEQVLAGAEIVAQLLSEAPALKIITTSREPLQLQGEQIVSLGGLAYGSPETEIESMASAQALFVARARLVSPEFEPDPTTWPHIQRICTLLEGLPLGIELASAWVQSLSCQEIAAELEHNLDFLATSLRNVPPRQRSLQAVFEYVWQNLSPQEQKAFSALTVFRGAFDVSAAQAVAGVTKIGLSRFVAQSLLTKQTETETEAKPGETRYHLLEVLRYYARRKLTEASVNESEVQDRHAEHFINLLRHNEAEWLSQPQVMVRRVAVNLDNIRAAWRWLTDRQRFDLLAEAVNSLLEYYLMRGPFQEGLALLETSLAAQPETVAPLHQLHRAKLRLAQARLLNASGAYQAALEAAQQAHHLAKQAEDLPTQAGTLSYQGHALWRTGQMIEAQVLLNQALDLAQEWEARPQKAQILHELGIVNIFLGHYKAAEDYATQALVLKQKLGDRRGEGNAYNSLGMICWYRNDLAGAQTYYEKDLAICRALGNQQGMYQTQGNLGLVLINLHRYEEALRNFEEMQAGHRRVGDLWGQAWTLQNVGICHHNLGNYEVAWQCYQQSLEITRRLDIRWQESNTLLSLGHLHVQLGRYRQAEECYEAALGIKQETQEYHGLMLAHAWLALLHLMVADSAQAEQHAEALSALTEEQGDEIGAAWGFYVQGCLLRERGQFAEAMAAQRQSLAGQKANHLLDLRANTLANLAWLAQRAGQRAVAADYLRQTADFLAQWSINGAIEPLEVYWRSYKVAVWLGGAGAAEWRQAGLALFNRHTENLRNPALRQSFLQSQQVQRLQAVLLG